MWLPAAYRDGVVLDVTVQTGASSRKVSALSDGVVKARVCSAPVEGQANAELVKLLSLFFQVPRARIEIVAGVHSRRKRVYLGGVTPSSAVARLKEAGLIL